MYAFDSFFMHKMRQLQTIVDIFDNKDLAMVVQDYILCSAQGIYSLSHFCCFLLYTRDIGTGVPEGLCPQF